MKKLVDHQKGLRWNFRNSIFPAITFNCGPTTVCVEHEDYGNAANMMCAITALGRYNPARGGHVVLYPLNEAYEFPSGSTILIPSSTLSHGNTPIARNEIRQSITQYCAGGLLRWVEYDFRSAKTLMAEKGGPERREAIDRGRWQWALGLFSKAVDLANDRLQVFTLQCTT